MRGKQTGFTIVELLIVIVVIAILASISIVSYNGVTNRARSTKNKVTASEVTKKAEIWNSELSAYPTFAQLKTNSLSPTQPGGVWTAGGAAGPAMSKLSSSIVLVASYPANDNEIGYITCSTPGGGYAIYPDPITANTVNALPYGSPTAVIYGSGPACN